MQLFFSFYKLINILILISEISPGNWGEKMPWREKRFISHIIGLGFCCYSLFFNRIVDDVHAKIWWFRSNIILHTSWFMTKQKTWSELSTFLSAGFSFSFILSNISTTDAYRRMHLPNNNNEYKFEWNLLNSALYCDLRTHYISISRHIRYTCT